MRLEIYSVQHQNPKFINAISGLLIPVSLAKLFIISCQRIRDSTKTSVIRGRGRIDFKVPFWFS